MQRPGDMLQMALAQKNRAGYAGAVNSPDYRPMAGIRTTVRRAPNYAPVSCREFLGYAMIALDWSPTSEMFSMRDLRLVIYIGMLANHKNLISNVLSASLERYIGGSLDPTLWLQNPRNMPLHQLVAQHRVQRTMSGDTVVEFILCMKRLLSCHGDFQHSCILCKKLLPTRWMIILCEGCEHTLIGGGRDTLSPSGIQILCLQHRMVEDIHKRRLSGSSRTPSVMVDAISEGMVLAVIAGTETGGN